MRLLEGVTVLEVSGRVRGAYCGRTLADLGASVTRVEIPLVADALPSVRPLLERSLHAGKSPVRRASAEALRCAAACDLVVVDVMHDDAAAGSATGAARRLLAVRDPDRPVLDLTDFRRPDTPGTPLTSSAASAASWSIGEQAREPLSIPFDVPDYLAGSEGAGAAVLCLLEQQAGMPVPARWELAAADAVAYFVSQIVCNFVPYGRPWHRDGPRASMSGGSYPAAIFPCADGAVAVMCRQPREWEGVLAAMGDPAWAAAPDFRDPRVVARRLAEEADVHVKAWMAAHTLAELVSLGAEHGFPVAPVRRVAETLSDPQYAHRGFFVGLPGEEAGGAPVSVPGIPYKLVAGPHARPARASARATPTAPLAGMRVLDLTWVWSGPAVCTALGDLGADVIKIEHENRPDSARVRGAALSNGNPLEGPRLELSPYFNQMNHGKRSVAADITTSEGADLVRAIAATCDVVVENMRAGALERRGLGFEALSVANPAIVMLSMSVAGRGGPMGAAAGYAPIMSGLAGLEALVGYDDAEPMGLFNLALADPNATGHGLAALLAAVHHQRRTGRGCWIDLSQMECVSAILRGPLIEAQLHGHVSAPGNGHRVFSPHGNFRCAGGDEWVAVAVRTDAERARLRGLLHASDGDDLEDALRAWLAMVAPDDAVVLLRGLGIPASPVRSFEQLRDTDRIAAFCDHAYIGSQEIVALPWRIGGRRLAPRSAGPLLGHDTEAVLAEVT